MRLYNYWRSSASWRVRIALHWKGLPFDYVPIHLAQNEQRQSAYRQLNAMEQVPTLEFETAGHTIRLAQSLAILEYLEEIAPEPPLLPRDPILRARVRQFSELINSGIQPLQNLKVLRTVQRLGNDEKLWAREFISDGLLALAHSAKETAGAFLIGDVPTFADVCLVPQLYGARRFEVDLATVPLLTRIEAACMRLPAFAAAHADLQPDATKS
jgi:maleylpyruvate isomerase